MLLIQNKKELYESACKLLEIVGLNQNMFDKYPHEFSGGQRQRIAIARAITTKPSLIICDEPVSALDVSVQSQIINLLKELQKTNNIAYLFISHDLSIVKYLSDRIAVMYFGSIVELASKDELYNNPLHPYTKALLSAIPIPEPKIDRKRKHILLSDDIPNPYDPPSGCKFHTRCPLVSDKCKTEIPQLDQYKQDHWVSCFNL